MTTIRDRSVLGAEPKRLLVHLSRGVHPISLVTSGVIRRAVDELPVAVGPHPGRRPSRPVAPHREERCPATSIHVMPEISRS
jgi:hypothetical protein